MKDFARDLLLRVATQAESFLRGNHDRFRSIILEVEVMPEECFRKRCKCPHPTPAIYLGYPLLRWRFFPTILGMHEIMAAGKFKIDSFDSAAEAVDRLMKEAERHAEEIGKECHASIRVAAFQRGGEFVFLPKEIFETN